MTTEHPCVAVPADWTDVVTFGEIMIRLAPPGFERFLQSPQFLATFGGGEANVAVALAQFGQPSRFATVLPGLVRRIRAEVGM